jgi:Clp amino terminal domain, pathogenicity island component
METVEALAQEVISRAGAEDPLTRLSAAVLTAEEVRDVADDLLDQFVTAAREGGRSWSEIGEVLGVTKQAAQQRFVTPGTQDFASAVRALLTVAEREARSFHHRYVGTEHLLLALIEDAGLAGAALQRLGVTAGPVRRRVLEIVGEGSSGEAVALGVTPRTKRILEASGVEARRLGHRCVASEHVLLALGSHRAGVAVQILRERGVGNEQIRGRLSDLLAGEAPEVAAGILHPPRRRLRRRR